MLFTPRDSLHPHNPEERYGHRMESILWGGSFADTRQPSISIIKRGRFPIEVLVRGKDAAENEKLFLKIADKIKEAGVSKD